MIEKLFYSSRRKSIWKSSGVALVDCFVLWYWKASIQRGFYFRIYFCLLLYPAFTLFKSLKSKKSKKSHTKSLYICYVKPRSSPFQVCNSIKALLLSRSTKESNWRFDCWIGILLLWSVDVYNKHPQGCLFFMVTTVIKKEKRGKYSFLFFIRIYLFFWSCQNERLHRIPLSRLIHYSRNSNNMFNFSLYSKRSRSLLIRVIASTNK